MKQLELDFGELAKTPILSNCTKMLERTPVPGCPRCEGHACKEDTPCMCWDCQLVFIKNRERAERLCPEAVAQERGIIETMKRDILEASAQGRPMPWMESEDMTANERRDFQRRIFIAMRETGTVIITPPQPEPKKRNGIKRNK